MEKLTQDDKLVTALLQCLKKSGWRGCTPAVLARAAKVPLATATTFLEPANCCRKIAAYFTRLALQDYHHETQNSVRDSLFELMMLRFDALQIHRVAIGKMAQAARQSPRLGMAILQSLPEQMAALLRASGCGAIHPHTIIGLTAIHLAVYAVWSRDESADLVRTMAALDKHLHRAETMQNKLCFFGRTPAEP